MKNKKVILLLLLLLITYYLLPITNTFAQNSATNAGAISPIPTPAPSGPSVSFLTISPPVRELELPRGSSNSYQMSILNQGDSSVSLILRASPFIAAGDAGGVSVDDEGLPSSQDWVIINPNILTLESGERR